jgi:hypothetical protein
MATPHSSNRAPIRAICTRALLVVLALSVTCSVYDESLLAPSNAGSAGSIDSGDKGGSGAAAGSLPTAQGGAGTGGLMSGGTGGASAGGGGTSGNGGAAGIATAAAAGDGNSAGGPAYELIDDMEDNDRLVLISNGRDGYWQTENDFTVGSTQVPLPGQSYAMTDLVAAGSPREGSLYAAGMHVTGFVNSAWGALMVVSMRATSESIDASAFCGLHFWAKRGTGIANLVLRVVDKHSSPQGGLCTDSADAGIQQCYDDFHIGVGVSTEWSEQMVRFSDLTQLGFGYQSPTGQIDPATIHGIVFSVDEAPDYELLIDDLAFVHAGHCG